MKKITLLLAMIMTTLLLSIPTFADYKELLPVSAFAHYGVVCGGYEYFVNDTNFTYKYKVVAGMKCRLFLATKSNVKSVKWSRKGVTYSDSIGQDLLDLNLFNNMNNYKNGKEFSNELTFKKDEVIYATVSDGKNTLKIAYDVKVIPVRQDHVAPIYFGYEINEKPQDDKENAFTTEDHEDYAVDDYSIKTKYSAINVSAKPNEEVVLYIGTPFGFKPTWSKKGKVESYEVLEYGNEIINPIKVTKNEKVTCTFSVGKVKSVVAYNIMVNNNFKASVQSSVKACKNKAVKIPVTVSGNDITKIKAKKITGNGSGFSFKNNVISYTPKASGELVFTLTDKFGNVKELFTKITVGDHVCNNWKRTKEPTAIKNGEETGTCSICGTKLKQTVAKLKATISMPTTKKIQINKKEKITFKLANGDYIVGVAASKMSINNKKVTVINVKKGKDYIELNGVREGSVDVTVKTKAGAVAKCTVQVVK